MRSRIEPLHVRLAAPGLPGLPGGIPIEERGPEQEASLKEAAALLKECLEGLPDQQRAAFQLKEVDMLPSEEARNVLGVADTHLRVLLFRARAKLRECLEKKWGKAA